MKISRRKLLLAALGVVGSPFASAGSLSEELVELEKYREDLKNIILNANEDTLLGYNKEYSMLVGFVALDCPHCQKWLKGHGHYMSALAERNRFFLAPLSPAYKSQGHTIPLHSVKFMYGMMVHPDYGPTSKKIIEVATLLSERIVDDKHYFSSVDEVYDFVSEEFPEDKKHFKEVVLLANTDRALTRYTQAISSFLSAGLNMVPSLIVENPETVLTHTGSDEEFLRSAKIIFSKAQKLNGGSK